MVDVTVRGVGIGHSAHVARHGYIPAAPFADPDCVLSTVAAWLTDPECAALDATEPNYRRLRLPTRDMPLTPRIGTTPPQVDVYVSRHGLLADPDGPHGGHPIGMRTQVDLFDWLAHRLDDPTLLDDPAAVCDRLAEKPHRAALTASMRAAGLVVRCGSPLSDADLAIESPI